MKMKTKKKQVEDSLNTLLSTMKLGYHTVRNFKYAVDGQEYTLSNEYLGGAYGETYENKLAMKFLRSKLKYASAREFGVKGFHWNTRLFKVEENLVTKRINKIK